MNVIAQRDVTGSHGRTGQRAAFADDGGTRHAHTRGHGSMVTNLAVVADHDLIVELYAVAQHGVFERTAVDRGIGTDLAIVADDHATQLRDFGPRTLGTRVGSEPEAVGTQHAAGMQNGAIAHGDTVVQGDVRVQQAIFAQRRARTNDTAGAKARTTTDAHAVFDHAVRTDADALSDLR